MTSLVSRPQKGLLSQDAANYLGVEMTHAHCHDARCHDARCHDARCYVNNTTEELALCYVNNTIEELSSSVSSNVGNNWVQPGLIPRLSRARLVRCLYGIVIRAPDKAIARVWGRG